MRATMEMSDDARRPSTSDFETEAMRFIPNVARYARLLTRDEADADDLTQETCLRAYQNWNTFRPGTDCRKWLCTICRSIYLRDRQRSQRFVALENPEHDVTATRQLYIEGRSYADAAAIAGVPIGTIRSRLFRARRLLQEALLEHARDAGLVADGEPAPEFEAAGEGTSI